MKDLKFIKLFEAFESQRLGKTLNYITKASKNTFLSYLKRVCDSLDFPYSEISDDYIEYLPFNAALKRTEILTDEPCDAKSTTAFERDYGIEGENCEKGMIKRKWGRGVRVVTCPVCNGTGVKAKTGEPKLVKFWFTKDGLFNTITCVDGVIRKRNPGGFKITQDRARYTHNRVPTITGSYGGRFDRESTMNLQSGQYVLINNRRAWENNGEGTYGIICREGRSIYVVTDRLNGDNPSARAKINGEPWRNYGRYGWIISGGSFNTIQLVTPKGEDTKEAPNPYDWNTDIYFSGSRIISRGQDIENSVKDSHFALVLDLSKLKETEYKTMKSIKDERKEAKSGAIAFQADDSIRHENIQRYINELSKRMEVDSSLGNVKLVIRRLLGGKNAFYFTRTGRSKDAIADILNGYIRLMQSNGDEDYLNDLNRTIKDHYENIMDTSSNVNRNLRDVVKKLESDTREYVSENIDKYKSLISSLELLGMDIVKTISSMDIESIDDIEIVYQKMLSMKNILSTNRYKVNKLSYFIDYLGRSDSNYAYSYLTERYRLEPTDIEGIIASIEQVKSIFKKM